jgi:hypothetical protein
MIDLQNYRQRLIQPLRGAAEIGTVKREHHTEKGLAHQYLLM